MTQDPTLSPDQDRLQALADGRLPPVEAAELRARLDAAGLQSVHAWQEQRQLLRTLHREVLDEQVPPALAQAARRAAGQRQQAERWQRWGGMAATVLLAFGAGWAAHSQWDVSSGGTGARTGRMADFGRQAAVAHAVYSPEVRHPVEVPASEQEHLVQWLSKRLGRALKVPDLRPQGYELVGGRLLPGDQGARAQFMYQNARAERITLYVGAIAPRLAGAAPGTDTVQGDETAFRFTTEAGASTFYWVDQGFGYALAGRLGRAELQPLADSVYRQL